MQKSIRSSAATLTALLILLTGNIIAQRSNDGIVSLFLFSEGAGEFAIDHANQGIPIILNIEDQNRAEWLADGGLSINESNMLRSVNETSLINDRIASGTGITLEAWIRPESIDQTGPARIFTYSYGTSNRNFMLGHNGTRFVARMRTTATDNNGMPALETPNNVVTTGLHHLVYTWDNSTGNEYFWIDGQLRNQGNRGGSVSNWGTDFKLGIANEFNAERPWLGDIHLAAIYNKPLNASEIQMNFEAGIFGSGSVSSETCPEECNITGFGLSQRVLWIPGLPNNMYHQFRFADDGGQFDVFEDGTAHIYGPLINMEEPEAGFYLDAWFTNRMNWGDWSALGRGWKGTGNIVGNLYETWDYYIVDSEMENVLIGTGSLEGSLLNLSHNPVNYYYGLQVGLAANDQNAEPGLSCWFNYNGTVSGQNVNGDCDINLEGDCIDVPVLSCAADIEVPCGSDVSPEVTGYPVLGCPDGFTLSYSDSWIQQDCPFALIRTWTAVGELGEVITCEQTISAFDNVAPEIVANNQIWADCENDAGSFDFSVVDSCDPNPTVSISILDSVWITPLPCEPGMFRTQTMGGWGAVPNGNNPGAYLHANFADAFPNGLTIGCNNTLLLTSAQAITDFLPSGTAPALLPEGALTDPGQNYQNVLAGQLVALTLSRTFDSWDPDFGSSELSLGELELLEGSFSGFTVDEILQIANEIIGGCPSQYSPSQVNSALTSINENFVDGTSNEGALDCEVPFDCYLLLQAEITATDDCGNTTTSQVSTIIADTTAPEFPDMPVHIAVSCDDIPEPDMEVVDACFSELVTVSVETSEYSGGCNTTLQYVWIATDQCGNQSTFTQFVTILDEEAPVFLSVPQNLIISCGQPLPQEMPVVTDNCDDDVQISISDQASGEGCEQLVLRTFTAIDNCGNTTSAQQTIIIIDDTAPVFSGVPIELNYSCEDNFVLTSPVVTDNCDVQPLVQYVESSQQSLCGEIITRQWIATDFCGNQSGFTQTVTITDDAPPVFIYAPANLDLACGSIPPVEMPVAYDLCSDVEIFWSESFSVEPGYCPQVVRTFIATDACGNAAIHTQYLTFTDDEAPVLTGIPENITTSCSSLPEPAIVSAGDNCAGELSITLSEEWGGAGCSLILVRTWTATDNCGNSSSASQTIWLNDDEAPVFVNAPQNVIIGCGDPLPSENIQVFDYCDQQPDVLFSEIIAADGCTLIYTRTWTATDNCGNSSEHTQVIERIDDAPPVFTSIPPSYNLSCGMNPFFEEAIAEDNCSQFSIALDTQEISNDCGTTIIRTWTATDACGNESSAQQEIFIGDINPPQIMGVPANIQLNCDEVIPAPAEVSFTDNCSAAEISLSENILPGNCGSSYTLVRTWTATDACGNSAVASQTITISDTEAPVFDFLPEDINADCGNIPPAPELTASDNCGPVSISYEEDNDAGGCPNIIRRWIATDACGNSAEALQFVYVQDNEPPLISGVPDNVIADCNNIPEMPEPMASDNCDDNVDLTVNINIVGTGCEYTIVRTWIATDDCGNTSIISQSITVQDTQAPVFLSTPVDITVECAQLSGIPFPQVMDDCAATVQTYFEDQPLGDGCEYDILRTYYALDQCGNSATTTQLIHVYDQSPPSFIGVPSNQYVDCSNVPAPPAVQAVDACSGVDHIAFQELQFGNGCSYYLQRTWTAVDGCGNAASITYLVYVNDIFAPTIAAVPNQTINCNEEWPAPANPLVSDNCSQNVQLNFIQFTEDQGCAEILTRIWSAIDACGNATNRIQYITRTDLDEPVLSGVPQNVTVSCDNIPAPAIVTAIDNCDPLVTVTMEEVVFAGNCPYSIVRTWTATDECGNNSSASQTIWVYDNEAPSLSNLPEDVIVNCDEIPQPEFPVASDNCFEGISVMMMESVIPGEDCQYQIVRLFSATDLCGNTAIHTQAITVVDMQAPQFAFTFEEITVECNETPPFEMLAAADNCDPQPLVVMEETIIEGQCPTEQTILRVWTATDACGNTSSATQIIHVEDNNPPSMVGIPDDIVINCSEIPEPPTVVGWDECQGILPVTYSEEVQLLEPLSDICNLGTAVSPAGDVAIWLPGLDGYADNYVFGMEGGYLEENPANGTALITGTVYNPQNANQGWQIHIELESRRNWLAWSALGRSYKDDLGFGEPFHEDWIFYEIVNGSSTLTGVGEFEGSVLSLTHAPSNYYYGIQIGWGANNRNGAYGMSGWFDYTGNINGMEVSGMGDILTENNCCPEQLISRTWTVTDCAGNTLSHTQFITVTNDFPEPQLFYVQNTEEGEFDVWTNGDGDYHLTFRLPADMQVSIDMFNINGLLLGNLYAGEARGQTEYHFKVPAGRISSGLYVFRLTGQDLVLTDTELVNR